MTAANLFTGASLGGDEINYLLDPITPEAFVREHWARRPLFVKGYAEKFASLFDGAAFDRAVRASEQPSVASGPFSIRASFSRGAEPGQPRGRQRTFDISRHQVPWMYEAGATICVDWISEGDPRLRELAHAIKMQLGYPGFVRFNAYRSPDGCGFNTHFDARIATTLQIEGSKVWTYSRKPAVDWPVQNAFRMADGSTRYPEQDFSVTSRFREANEWENGVAMAPSDFEDVLLEPGDLLVLPAGTWHSAKAEGHSLALNLTFEPMNFADLLREMLKKEFETSSAWRAVPPYLTLPVNAGEHIPLEMRDYIAQRLAEATKLFTDVPPDGNQLLSAWGRNVADEGNSGLKGTAHLSPAPAGESPSCVRKDDELRHPSHQPLLRIKGRCADGAAGLTLYVGAREMEVRGDLQPLVECVARHRRFKAGSVLEWPGVALTWEHARDVLQLLVTNGFLERAAPSPSLGASHR